MKRKKKFYLVIILIILTLGVLGIALFLKLSPSNNYSIVYSDNGWLYYNNENYKLGRGTIDTVEYANDRSKFLYKLENDLYFHDKNKEQKIATEIKEYAFANNDKAIVYINIDNKLAVYLNKKNIDITENVNRYLGSYQNKIYYYKSSTLYAYDLNKQKDEEIAPNVYSVQFKENKLIYLDSKNSLNVYDLKSSKKITSINNVNIYESDEEIANIAYINNEKTLFLYDKEEHKVDDEVYSISNVLDYVVYTKIEDNNIKYYVANKENKVAFNITGLDSCKMANNKMYCLTTDGNLYSISEKLDVNKVAEHIYDKMYEYNEELYILALNDNHNNLYKVNNDKIEEIDSDVVMSSIKIGNDKMYYLKNQEDKYNLHVYDKKKATLLREKIDSYYIIGKNIYLLKDYKEADLNGSLYLYNKRKDKMIISKITALAEKNSN